MRARELFPVQQALFHRIAKVSQGQAKVLNRLGPWTSPPCKIKAFAKTDQILANANEANKMCKRDREYTDAELSLENAQYRMANLLRAAYDEGYVEGFVEKYTEGYARRYAEIYTKLDAERGAECDAESYQKHYEEGLRQARIAAARDLLEEGKRAELIKKYTFLSDAEIAELQK